MNQDSIYSKPNDFNRELDEGLENISYTYWKRESDNPFSKEFNPQKNENPIIEDNINKNSLFGSIWNKAGTWEEKHLIKTQVEDFITKRLSDSNSKIANSFILEKISSFSGDVIIFFLYIFVLAIFIMTFFSNCKYKINLSIIS